MSSRARASLGTTTSLSPSVLLADLQSRPRSTLQAVRDGLTGAAQQIAIAYIEKKIGAA